MAEKKKRLQLNKRTISDLRDLGANDLAQVVGGKKIKSETACPSVDFDTCPVTPCKKKIFVP